MQELQHAKDKEYFKRRKARQHKRLMRKRQAKRAMYFYVPTSFFLILGTTSLIMSTVPGLGNNTIFWENKTIFHILGACCAVVGIVCLMATEGYSHWLNKKKEEDTNEEEKDRVEILKSTSQKHCLHQERIWKMYIQNGFKRPSKEQVVKAYKSSSSLDGIDLMYDDKPKIPSPDIVLQKTRPVVKTISTETQTDQELLMKYYEKRRERGSFRGKKKLCQQDSSNSGSYSYASLGTQMTDISDDIDEEDLISYDDNDPLSVSHPDNIKTAQMFFLGTPMLLTPIPNEHEIEVDIAHLDCETSTKQPSVDTDDPTEHYIDRSLETHVEHGMYQNTIPIVELPEQTILPSINFEHMSTNSLEKHSPDQTINEKHQLSVETRILEYLKGSAPDLSPPTGCTLEIPENTYCRRASWTVFE